MELTVETDGAARGNPGEASAAFIVADRTGRPLCECAYYLGKTTNNVAEYVALVRALEACAEIARRQDVALGKVRVTVQTDSELMAKQLAGEYKVRSARLRPHHHQVRQAARTFAAFHVHHVGRDENQRSDALANRILDHRED